MSPCHGPSEPIIWRWLLALPRSQPLQATPASAHQHPCTISGPQAVNPGLSASVLVWVLVLCGTYWCSPSPGPSAPSPPHACDSAPRARTATLSPISNSLLLPVHSFSISLTLVRPTVFTTISQSLLHLSTKKKTPFRFHVPAGTVGAGCQHRVLLLPASSVYQPPRQRSHPPSRLPQLSSHNLPDLTPFLSGNSPLQSKPVRLFASYIASSISRKRAASPSSVFFVSRNHFLGLVSCAPSSPNTHIATDLFALDFSCQKISARLLTTERKESSWGVMLS